MNDQKRDIVDKIVDYEKRGLFDQDIFIDPPTKQIKPGTVDYKYSKLFTKISAKVANFIAKRYINKLIRKNILIIKDVFGIENYRKIKNSGAVITCNHFSPFDNFLVYKSLEKELNKECLYKIIREGNFTNFPGLFGYFFRHCNTLPLSSNISTMKEFSDGVKYHLGKKRKILIYPEQALWPNYQKPRPLKSGAFSLAVSNNVPILPIFITFNKNSDDNFEYVVHILEPVFPIENISRSESIKKMSDYVYLKMKEKYEEVYKIPLKYSE